ncbi:TPA: conjugal transfer protein TraG [Clostridioides difficile]|nr:conjugal transfer protein TraG [Clostridioides difficile]MDI2978155.1 conjugal transfer protein TraG [Clostridioides difficile]MDI6151098.1 conjugal transfer protein TraG [Clostridioides difficile]MDI7827549.1 conjugal transfer protein TraG [Clostridioides difficile]
MIKKELNELDLTISSVEVCKCQYCNKIKLCFEKEKYKNRYLQNLVKDRDLLYGDEDEAIENTIMALNILNSDSPQFFKDMSDCLVRKSVKLLKRLYGDDATLIDLNDLVWNSNGIGKKIVKEFSRLSATNPIEQKENDEIVIWFIKDYYSGMTGGQGGTKTYEHCSGARAQIYKLISMNKS